jgi:hypothetical protein
MIARQGDAFDLILLALLVLLAMFGPWVLAYSAVWLAGASVGFYSIAHAIGAFWAVGFSWMTLTKRFF